MLFLHHYPTSPWGEVIRLAMGLKDLHWQSVDAPVILPKPELQELTGGYARIPVLQIGADIYCDTAMIAEALEVHAPTPTLFPAGDDTRALAATAQGPTFFAAIGAAFEGLSPEGLDDFWADRESRFGMKREALLAMAPALNQAFEAHLDGLDARLADGRPWLEGDAAGHADLAHYQLLWFQDMMGAGAPRFTADRRHLLAWMRRVATIGHGHPHHVEATAALRAAAEAEPAPIDPSVDPASGFSLGDRVAVSQTGCNDPAVAGELLWLDSSRIVVRRKGNGLGTTHVHFPRAGQELARA